MKFLHILPLRCIVLAIFLIKVSFHVNAQDNHTHGIIPMPQSIESKNGTFKLSAQTALVYATEEDLKIAELFRELVKEQ
ncbi:hypothetical protein EIM50_25280, partial [Pseudoxanthomonas sp. SGD-10]